MKIKSKMIFGFSMLITALIILSILSSTQLNRIGSAGYHTVTDNLQSLGYLNSMQSHYNNTLIHLKNTYFAEDDEGRVRFREISAGHTDSFFEQADLYIQFSKDSGKEAVIIQKMEKLVSLMQEHEALREEAFRLSFANDSIGANNYSTTVIMPVGNQIYAMLDEIYEDNVTAILDISKDNYQTARIITWIVAGVSVLSILIAAAWGFFYCKRSYNSH